MNIVIGWEYFLGIFGALLCVAWYSSGRFTRIETDITWMKKDITWMKKTMDSVEKKIGELKIGNDNKNTGAFAAHSPIALTEKGREILRESGMEDFIDANLEKFFEQSVDFQKKNPYKIQQHIFGLFDSYEFPEKEFNGFQRFAFEKGISMEIVRRVGAIHFRDIYLEKCGHKQEDIDKHSPLEA